MLAFFFFFLLFVILLKSFLLCGYRRAYRKHPIVKTVHFMLTETYLCMPVSVLFFYSPFMFFISQNTSFYLHICQNAISNPLFSDIFHFIHFSSRLVFGSFLQFLPVMFFCSFLPFFFFFLTSLNSLSVGEGNGTPLQYSCLENPMDGGAW